MDNKIGIGILANAHGVEDTLKRVGKSLSHVGRNTKESSKEFAKFQQQTKKLNNKFNNINRDANRSAKGLSNMTKSMRGLNQVIGTGKLYMLANSLAKVVQSSIDSIETTNLFNVAMGDMAVETEKTVQELTRLYGLDATNLRSSIGTYGLLARSMGMTSEQSSVLSSNMAKLAIDYSSVTNVPINQVMADFKSGLLGQSETVYKYGMDVTEAGIKQEALAQGITKSVRNMSQGEKMALRYSAMIRNSALAQGDFARTVDTPANQLKILSERFVTLSRSIGDIFIPILSAVLPYLNGIVIMLNKVAQAIAKFFGYEAPEISNGFGSGLEGMTGSANDSTEAINNTSNALKSLKKATMGFDQLNIIPEPPSTPTTGSGVGGVGGNILDGFNMTDYDNKMSGIIQKSDEIASKLESQFSKLLNAVKPTTDSLIRLWDEGLKPIVNFTAKGAIDFYTEFLKPMGKWALGENGLPKLIDSFTDLLKEIDWTKLNNALREFWRAVEPLAESFGQGFIDFVSDIVDKMKPWVAEAFSLLADAIEEIAAALKKVDPKTAQAFGEITGFLVVLGGGIKVGAKVIGFLGSVGTFLGKLKDVVPSISGFLNGGGLTALINGLSNLSMMNPIAIPMLFDALIPDKWKADWEDEFWNIYEIEAWLDEFWNTLWDEIVKSFKKVFNFDKTKELWDEAIQHFKDAFDGEGEWYEIGGDIVRGIMKGIRGAFSFITEPICDFFNEVTQWLKDVFGIASPAKKMKPIGKDILRGVVAGFTGSFGDMWEAIKEFGKKVKEKLRNAWDNATEKIKDKSVKFSAKVETTVGWVKEKWNALAREFKNKTSNFGVAVKTTTSWVKSKWSELSGAFKNKTADFKVKLSTKVGSIKNFIKDIIDEVNEKLIAKLRFSIKAPSWLGGGTWGWSAPKIPYLAKGGIVDKATLSIIGEAGKEAVMPLENNTGWIDNLAGQIVTKGGIGGGMSKNDMKNAFKEAIKESDFGDTVLYLGNEQVARASNKGNKLLNRRYKLVTE